MWCERELPPVGERTATGGGSRWTCRMLMVKKRTCTSWWLRNPMGNQTISRISTTVEIKQRPTSRKGFSYMLMSIECSLFSSNITDHHSGFKSEQFLSYPIPLFFNMFDHVWNPIEWYRMGVWKVRGWDPMPNSPLHSGLKHGRSHCWPASEMGKSPHRNGHQLELHP